MPKVHALLKLSAIAFLLSICTKESSFDCTGKLKGVDPINIRSCIVGTWDMVGSSGGFTGQGLDVTDRQVKFTSNDSIYYFIHGQKAVADKIVWVNEKDFLNEQAYLMKFKDVYGLFNYWGIDGIYSEKLTIYENGNDGFVFYLKKRL